MLKDNNDRPSGAATASATESGEDYKVGPGRPPKEYQFKPGQSGNPKGAKRKPKSVAPDLKAALEQALSKPIKLKQGEKERIVSMAVAGIEQLVVQFAKGNPQCLARPVCGCRQAPRRSVGQPTQAIKDALAANHEAILRTYVERQYDKVVIRARVFAPPELLDDDPQDPKKN